jgi:hypothetical protein
MRSVKWQLPSALASEIELSLSVRERIRFALQRRLRMTIGMIFYIIAAIIFFLGGVGSTVIGPNPSIWGLFCLALGLLLDGYDFGLKRRA